MIPSVIKSFFDLFDSLSLLFFLEGFRHINFVKIGRIPHLACRQHLIGGRKEHPGNRNGGAFLTTTFHDALIFGFVVRRLV